MSVRALQRVWLQSRQDGGHLLVMLALADFADDSGRAHPGVPALAAKCRMSTRHANRILADLRDAGELEIRFNEGPKGVNRYRITLHAKGTQPLTPMSPLTPDADVSPSPDVHVTPEPLTPTSPPDADVTLTSTSSTPDAGVLNPLTPTSDEPSLNRQGTEKKKTRERAPSLPCPDDVEPQVWTDWQAVRQAKRAGPITLTVMRSIRAEAAKAGLDLQQALETSCRRNWVGFEADWLKPSDRQYQRGGKSFATTDYSAGVTADGRVADSVVSQRSSGGT